MKRQTNAISSTQGERKLWILNEPRVKSFRFWMFMGKKKRHLSFGNHVVIIYTLLVVVWLL